MSENGSGPLEPGGRWAKLGVIASLLSAAAAVPAAIMATVQAFSANAALTSVRVESAELKRIAAASEMQLKEARRLAAAAERENAETARVASAAGDAVNRLAELGTTADRQRAALDRSSAAAQEIAEAAKRQTEANERQFGELSRPKVVHASSSLTLEANQRVQASVELENLNPATPADIWYVMRFVKVVPGTHVSIPACGKGELRGVIGKKFRFVQRNGPIITPADVDEMKAGTLVVALVGTVCYRHGERIFRTRICRVSDWDETSDCGSGNSVD